MKLFNKFVSIVTVVAFVLSMMAVPAFAAGLEDYPTADGNEKLVVTYYSDAACENAITTAEPGATVYAKVSASLPTKTLRSLDVNLTVANATIEAQVDKFTPVMGATTFNKVADTGIANTIYNDNKSANIAIALAQGSGFDSPTNAGESWFGEYHYTNTGIKDFDLVVYTLKLADTAGTVSFSNAGFQNNFGSGIMLGEINMDLAMNAGELEFVTAPFTVEGTLPIESAAQEPVITYSYDATIASTKVDPESATYEDDVKALVTVTKTTLSDGIATGTEEASAKSMTVNKAAKTVTVVFPDDTQKTLNYTEMVITYGTPVVTVDSSFDYAMTESEIADEVVVTVVKTKDGVDETLTLVEGSDYNAGAAFLAAANSGFVVIDFIGDYAGNTRVEKSFIRTNAPVSYKDVVATISGSPFAFGTTDEQIKAAIAVKGTKVEGVVETADATVPADAYEITVDLAAGTATVTMNDSTPVDNTALTFEISAETFTYSNYTATYTGENEYDYTVDADAIVALVKVTATKTGETTPAEEVDLTNEVDVVVDKDAGTITVTWKAESAHAGNDIDGAVISVTFNDVITYQNVNATMSKTSFADDATDDAILAFLTVTVEKLVNGVKEDGFVADYMATVDKVNNKVVVDFDDDAIEDKEIGITFYSSDAVVLKVVGGEGVTAGEVEESDGEFKAIINVDGLDTRVLYDAVLSISASAGVLEEVAVVTNSGYNVLPDAAIAGNVWTGKIYKGIEAVDLANGLLVVTVNTDGLADGTVIEVKVDSATLRIVEDTDFVPIDSTTEALEVEVNAFVRNVEAVTLNDVEIDIVTLGPVTDAKFVDGVSLVGPEGEVDLTGKVSLNSTARSIVIDDVALAVSATEDEVIYTLKVEVAGYTTIESEIVVSYNGEATNDWSVLNTLDDAKIYAGDVTGDDNTIAADDYSDVVAMYNQTAAFDIYEGGATIDLNDISTTVYMYDNYGMKLVNKATGVIAD